MDISDNREINILMKQTTYTREECIEKLKINNNDLLKCLKEYNGIVEKKIMSVTPLIKKDID